VAVAQACEAGRDAQRLAADLAEYLRQGFLSLVAGELVSLSGAELSRVQDTARRTGLAALVRGLEELGRAQVEMRDVPDPRVHLEVALIRLTHPQADDSTSALLERVERLERALADVGGARDGAPVEGAPMRTLEVPPSPPGSPVPARAGDTAPGPTPPAPRALDPEPAPAPDPGAAVGGPELARRTLGAVRRQRAGPARAGDSGAGGKDPAPSDQAAPAPSPGTPPGALATMPSRDDLVQVWGDGLLAELPNRARARFRVGRFLDMAEGTAVFALPNETHRSYCEEVRLEVEAALRSRFGTAVPITLVVDDEAHDDPVASRPARSPRPTPAVAVSETHASGTADDTPDLLDPEVLAAETEPAGTGLSPQERLKQAFPGAHEV
jgi:DNA polymerase III subunit gamma/tau